MNVIPYILVGLVIGWAIYSIIRHVINKRNSKGCSGCSGCSMRSECNMVNKDNEKE